MSAFNSIFSIIAVIFYVIYYFIAKKDHYWKKKGVPSLEPSILFGNYGKYITLRKCWFVITQQICKKFPDAPYVGVYYGTEPALVIQDPNIIKLIMAKDFYCFNSREIENYTHEEIITQNMFFTGGDRWKILRQNLNPLFSSSKLKNMFYLVENCANLLENVIDEELKWGKIDTIEIKALSARYTMDCVGSCAFGVNTGTLVGKDKNNNLFTAMGEKLFDISIWGGLKILGRSMWPAVFYGLGLKCYSEDLYIFFNNLICSVFAERSFKKSSRNDFVDLVLGWKQESFITGDSFKNLKTGEKRTVTLEVNDDLLVGQCIVFFAAGYETTSTTIGFIFYELAKNQCAQERVIEEVKDYFKRHDNKIQYDCTNEMPYLHACIDESLRLYPVLGVLTREVTEDYTLPTGLHLEKGNRVHIPIYHIHHNPKYFRDPEEFRPERFYGEERKNVKQFTYMPFGEGPRICIGMRFARMIIVAAMLTVFKKYRVELADDMPTNIMFQPRTFVTQALGGIRLKFIAHED